MYRIAFALITILALLAGCTAPQNQTAQPAPPQTAASVPATPTQPAPTQPPASSPEPVQPTATNPPPEPTSTPQGPQMRIAYIGPDGNLWALDAPGGQPRQLTQDAAGFASGNQPKTQVIAYSFPQLSSDGSLLAYRRDLGTPINAGYQFQTDLWVYDLSTGQARPLLQDQQITGFAWKPGTKLIAYGQPISIEYFRSRAPETASAIWAVEAGTGQAYELVKPERDYAIANPRWSPDARFLAFEEVLAMEGRGQFAYYDFEAQQYLAWDRIIGSYNWSPDIQQIAYDDLAYAANGTERVWISDLQGENARALSPQYENGGYAFSPQFSPQGDRLAYLANLSGPDTSQYTLYVMPLPDGEARSLGLFEGAQGLSWTPDGASLIFSAGPYEQQQLVQVSAADGSTTILAPGSQPYLVALQP